MKKLLCGILVLTAVLLPLSAGPLAVGVLLASPPSEWAAADVAAADAARLVPETLRSDYTQAATRAEFCALATALYENLRGEIAGRKTFEDTTDPNVEKCAYIGVVKGTNTSGTLFAPDDALSREQAATMLARLADAAGRPLAKRAASFADSSAISSWAAEAAGQVQAAGIMSGIGNNTFSPHGPYTREQSIVTMLRLYNIITAPAPDPDILYPMSALVEGSYLWGYVDSSGEFIIEPKYSYASEWNRGYGIVALPESADKCFVIDKTEARIVFALGERYTAYTFSLAFEDDVPSVRFVGNCVLISDMVTGIESHNILSLSTRKLAGSFHFNSYNDGIITGRAARGDTEFAFDNNGNPLFSAYGQLGAFHDGVAYAWGGLRDKTGGIVYEHTFPGLEGGILVYGLADETNWVGDSLGFRQNGRYGVVRADGTIILPADYEYVRLTPCKQILTGKAGETYRLRDASGKVIYTFPGYMTGSFYYDGSDHYMYRAANHDLIILSASGTVSATISAEAGDKAEFVGGLVRVVQKDGLCRYYDLTGRQVL